MELDQEAADRLAARFSGSEDAEGAEETGEADGDTEAGSNVEVVVGDATALQFPDESFDSVGTFTMLHHVPTVAAQNKLLAEALRVLRPGGVLVGSDSLASDRLHHFHEGDVYNPVEPAALLTRLQTLGFASVTVIVDSGLKFIARKAAPTDWQE